MRRTGSSGAAVVALGLVVTLAGVVAPTRAATAHGPVAREPVSHPPMARASAPPFNPGAGNQDFQVFVNTRAEIHNSSQLYGPLAIGDDLTLGPMNVALRAAATASSSAIGRAPANSTDFDPDTYWQGGTGMLSPVTPQTLTVDLGAATTVAVVQLRVPPA